MNESIDRYADMLHLPHHRSRRRPPMPLADRAAQFSSFAALAGHSEAIRETARLTEPPPELSDSAKAEIDERLRLIAQRPGGEVRVTHYVPDVRKAGGACISTSGVALKLTSSHLLLSGGYSIALDAIISLDLL